MQDTLDRHEAKINEVKQAHKKRRYATNKNLTDLNDLLNENDKESSEEKQDAAATETVVPV